MSLIKKHSNEELFWHVTNIKTIDSIKNYGIKKSINGQMGSGVYCILKDDFETLDSIIELMEQNNNRIENLKIVEFEHTGNYEIYEVNLHIESNEGWAIIKNNISADKIRNILDI